MSYIRKRKGLFFPRAQFHKKRAPEFHATAPLCEWVLSHWPMSLYIDSCVYVFVFCVFCQLHMCYVIVTWWGGPDGIEV